MFRDEAGSRPASADAAGGENSSGKSTFLAICRIARSVVEGPLTTAPSMSLLFLLGAYDQIASHKSGRRVKSFTIGLEIGRGREDPGAVEATFVSEAGQPALQNWRATVGSAQMRFEDVSRPIWQFTSRIPGEKRLQTLPTAPHFSREADTPPKSTRAIGWDRFPNEDEIGGRIEEDLSGDLP